MAKDDLCDVQAELPMSRTRITVSSPGRIPVRRWSWIMAHTWRATLGSMASTWESGTGLRACSRERRIAPSAARPRLQTLMDAGRHKFTLDGPLEGPNYMAGPFVHFVAAEVSPDHLVPPGSEGRRDRGPWQSYGRRVDGGTTR
jgi:hypothetical protein